MQAGLPPGPGINAPDAPQTQPPPTAPGANNPPPGPPPDQIPLHTGTSTPQPDAPYVRFDTGAPKRVSEQRWTEVSNDLYQSIDATLSARQPLMDNLREWSDRYDMIVEEKDFPFEDSSNVSLPYMPAQLESLVAYTAGAVIVPRMFIVQGNTPVAIPNAAMVEKFYNTELLRLRSDGSSYFSRLIDWLHMSYRDGTAVMEVLWNRQRRRKLSTSYVPKIDDLTGMPMMENGMPVWEERTEEVDVYVKDYAEWTPIPLKEFVLIPDEARSIEDAAAVARVEWLYEDQLDRMVRAGVLDSDECEMALRYAMMGTNDIASDRTGVYDKNASRQIAIGIGQGAMASPTFKNRGPIKVWRIHSRQHDMNGDGLVEENIFWLHELSQRMLGWMPYDYATGQRPFFSFSPFPRPDRFYGFSLPERLSGVQEAMDFQVNSRDDQIALRMKPPMFVKEGAEVLLKDGVWYPGAMIEVESNNDADPTIKIPTQPDIPISSWQQEALFKSYGNDYTGLSQPAMGTQGQGKRSATELKQQNMGQGTRLNLVNMRYRVSCQQVINFTHTLNKQYMKTSPQTVDNMQIFTVPLDVMAQDYTIGIAGMTDPLDSTTRKTEMMTLFELMMKVPLIAQNPLRTWYWMRSVLEAFGRADVYQLIGTEQDAQQAAQMMQAQQQLQLQMQAQQHAAQQTQNQPPARKPAAA